MCSAELPSILLDCYLDCYCSIIYIFSRFLGSVGITLDGNFWNCYYVAMTWTSEIIERIQHLFPKQRGNVVIDYLSFFQALQYIAENGCKWRALPKHFGNWNSIYYRFRYWAAAGVFDRIEKELRSQALTIKGVQKLALDSTYVKVHPNGTGAHKKKDRSPSVKAAAVGRPKSIPSLQMKTCR